MLVCLKKKNALKNKPGILAAMPFSMMTALPVSVGFNSFVSYHSNILTLEMFKPLCEFEFTVFPRGQCILINMSTLKQPCKIPDLATRAIFHLQSPDKWME